MNWRTDATLQGRMVAALALLLVGYAALLGLIVLVLPPQWALLAGGSSSSSSPSWCLRQTASPTP